MLKKTNGYKPVVITDTANLSETEWLEYRRKGVGGSDAAAVLGLSAFCACLFGNNDSEFAYRRIDRDLDYEQDIIGQEKYFWEEYVQKKIEPPYTESGNLTLESLRRKYGNADISAPSVTLDADTAELIEKYIALREQKLEFDHKSKDIENEMKKVYAPILDMMGVSCAAVCRSGSSEYTVSYNPSYREGINKDGLESLKVFNPEIYRQYVSTTESRRFNVKKKELNAS